MVLFNKSTGSVEQNKKLLTAWSHGRKASIYNDERL